LLYAVLDDPFDGGGIEVAGDHVALVFPLGARWVVLAAVGRSAGCEAEFLFQLTLDLHDFVAVDSEWHFDMQPGVDGFHVLAEAKHDALRLGLNRVEHGESGNEHEDCDDYPQRRGEARLQFSEVVG
jgi:hypothetical protein